MHLYPVQVARYSTFINRDSVYPCGCGYFCFLVMHNMRHPQTSFLRRVASTLQLLHTLYMIYFVIHKPLLYVCISCTSCGTLMWLWFIMHNMRHLLSKKSSINTPAITYLIHDISCYSQVTPVCISCTSSMPVL